MTDSAQPFAAKKFLEIKGRRMAFVVGDVPATLASFIIGAQRR